MIPSSVVFSFVIAAIFTSVVPIVIIIVLGIRRKISALPLLCGTAAFWLSQFKLRMPLISMLSEQSWYQGFAAQFFVYVLFLSFSAGLFEESARLGGAFLLKNHRSYKDIISFGLGHAFCEVILITGLANITNAFICLSLNSGSAAYFMSPEQTEAVSAWLSDINTAEIWLGILERFSAVVFHIFATMLVFTGAVKKKIRYYLLAVLIHTLFNFAAVLTAYFAGTAASEAMLFIAASVMGFYVLKQKKDFADVQQDME